MGHFHSKFAKCNHFSPFGRRPGLTSIFPNFTPARISMSVGGLSESTLSGIPVVGMVLGVAVSGIIWTLAEYSSGIQSLLPNPTTFATWERGETQAFLFGA